MGVYVHLSVTFACDTNEGVAELARKHLPAQDEECIEAKWFLDDLSKRTGGNPGPKGGLSTWGIVGNYTLGETFVEKLRPFWIDLLAGVEGGPHDFEHIIVFEEREQTEQAKAFEIFLKENFDGTPVPGDLVIREHDLPFCWNQM